MKNIKLLVIICLTYACQEVNSNRKVIVSEKADIYYNHKRETGLKVNIEKSVIKWKGTKFNGLGSHSGVIKLSSGAIYFTNGKISAGKFEIDMLSIEVTDIPESHPIPRKNLRNHLMDKDFFYVEKYAKAIFEINQIQKIKENQYSISGNLLMRGVSKNITFDAEFDSLSREKIIANARLSLNRQYWGVAYRGSKLKNDLVDDDILLDLYVETD